MAVINVDLPDMMVDKLQFIAYALGDTLDNVVADAICGSFRSDLFKKSGYEPLPF